MIEIGPNLLEVIHEILTLIGVLGFMLAVYHLIKISLN